MHLRAASSVVFGALALVLVACSSAAPPSSGSEAQTKSDPNKKDTSSNNDPSKSPAAASSAAPAKAANAPNTAQCAATANHEDCTKCCEGANGESVKVDGDAFNQCICNSAKAKCPAECATGYCDANGMSGSSSSSDDPCASCAPDFDGCDAQAKKACAADPTCAAAEKCYADAKCESKPAGPDEDTATASSSDDTGK